MTLRPSFRNSA